MEKSVCLYGLTLFQVDELTGFSETCLPCWPGEEQATENPFCRKLAHRLR